MCGDPWLNVGISVVCKGIQVCLEWQPSKAEKISSMQSGQCLKKIQEVYK